jgi:hypothetical protein
MRVTVHPAVIFYDQREEAMASFCNLATAVFFLWGALCIMGRSLLYGALQYVAPLAVDRVMALYAKGVVVAAMHPA